MAEKELTLETAPDNRTIDKCYHCGDTCKETLVFADKTFCCQGCQTVFELLNSSGLSDYYQLNQTPGIKGQESRFDYLDSEEIVRQLLNFENDKIAKITLFIPAIHCSSCIWLLENMAKLLPGIQQSRVHFIKKEITVTYYKDEISLRQLVDFLCQIGYQPEINLGSTDNKKSSKKNHSLGIKIGVAFFCFGNAMFISLPDYLDQNFLLQEDFKYYFGLINILLSLPVLFYSASDYFRSAFGGLRKRFVNIDVPIVLGILTLFGRSVYEIVMGFGTGYLDSLNGLVFFLLVGKWFQNKSYQALSFERDFKSFFPVAVERKNQNDTSYIQVEEIRKDDRLVIHNSEILPVDAILSEGTGQIDYSFVTGESVTEQKQKGDLLYAGGRHYGPPIVVKVTKEMSASYLTSLWNQEAFRNDKDHSFQNLIDRISGYFTITILAIATVAGFYWYLLEPSQTWMVVSSVLIVACPCALALSVPFAYGHAMRVLGRQKLYLKNADVVEKLAKVKQLIFDKTGTLTTTKNNTVTFQGKALTNDERHLLAAVTANSFHPFSRQINDWLGVKSNLAIDSFEELTGKGIRAVVSEQHLLLGSASFCDVEGSNGQSSTVYLVLNGEVRGAFEFNVGYRSGIFEMLRQLKKRYHLYLLSGDQDGERTKLKAFFHSLHFKQKPEDKLQFLNKAHTDTLMIGDGLNDAGALKQASVGIAVAEDIHQFSPSSDAILKGDRLVELPKFLKLSRFAVKTVYAAFTLSFLYNAIGLSFAITGNLTPLLSALLMPISSVTVVGFITAAISLRASRF